MREGASSQQLSREEIRELFYAEGLIYFDENPLPGVFAGRRPWDEEGWARFCQRAKIPGNMATENRPAQPAPDRCGWPHDPSRGVAAGP